MKVKELIEKLQGFDPDQEIILWTDPDLEIILWTDHGQENMWCRGAGEEYVSSMDRFPDSVDEDELDEWENPVKVICIYD